MRMRDIASSCCTCASRAHNEFCTSAVHACGMKILFRMSGFLYLFPACLFLATTTGQAASLSQQPPTPIWPDVFSIHLDILVQDYGPDWKSKGALYYNWHQKTFRADYFDWCLPLFDNSDFSNYSCSFLATEGNMYFVNHTGATWQENQCCLYAPGLAATPPDWMKNDQYNGTVTMPNVPVIVDVWWFPGTSDPTKPCYGYWNIRDKVNTPFQFFGLSAIGPTILSYHQFLPGVIEVGKELSKPATGCEKECKPSLRASYWGKEVKKGGGSGRRRPPIGVGAWPNWPSCD